MNNSIHLFIGNTSKSPFKLADLKGKLVFWNEQLHKGPLIADIGSDIFWKIRYQYYQETFQTNKLIYFDNYIKPIVFIEDLPKNATITIYARKDLREQINILALCTYLLRYYRKDVKYFITYIETEKSLDIVLQNSIRLSRNALLFAKQSWELWVKKDIKQLQEFNFSKEKRFPFLQAVITAFLNQQK